MFYDIKQTEKFLFALCFVSGPIYFHIPRALQQKGKPSYASCFCTHRCCAYPLPLRYKRCALHAASVLSSKYIYAVIKQASMLFK